MKHFLLASVVALLAVPAMAQTTINGGPQTMTGGQQMQAGGSQYMTGPAAYGGTVNNTIASAGGGGGYPSTIRNTPSVGLALATAYCQNNGGVTGSGPGFSFGLALGRHDIDCKRLNYAMLLEALGQREAALLVVANNEEVNAALAEAAKRAAAHAASRPAAPSLVSYGPRPTPHDCSVLTALAERRDATQDAYFRQYCGAAR